MGKLFDVYLDKYKNETVSKTISVNSEFLEKLKYLNDRIYHVSIAVLINASLVYLVERQTVIPYQVEKPEEPTQFTFYIKKSLLEEIEMLHNKYPAVSIGKLVNIAIHDALEFESDHLKNYNQNQFEE